ncbi:MAG: Hachiman antiphage defense system protein HamA [Anaeroplasma sp.]
MLFDDIFNVIEENEKYIFFYCNITNKNELIDKYFDYFFDEEVMYKHFNYLYNVPFIPTKENYNKLYRELKKFIDDFNFDTMYFNGNIEGIEDILVDENKLIIDSDNVFKYRSDKAGKIGEYFFSILLERFFGLQCVVPKSRFITDYNMSVYGIDVIYLREENNELFFCESKFTKNIYNGIAQINKSLESYEKQINDEYELILNAWDSRNFIHKLHDMFNEELSCSLSFSDFIENANIDTISIPLFIAHGTETNPSDIIENLNKVRTIKILDLKTKYVYISLPIIEKDEFIKKMSEKISIRMQEYENN